MSPLNESFCNTTRPPEPASVSVTRPSSTSRREMVERVRSESRRCSGPVDRACAVDAETDLRRHQAQLRGLHLAAQQRAKPDFEVDHAGPQPRLPAGFTDFDLAEPDSRNSAECGLLWGR